MREIKFRGKSDEDWVYGLLIKSNEDDFEHISDYTEFEIQVKETEYGEHLRYFITDKNTIGQYTGLKDKNGVEIYEGDIVKAKFFNKEIVGYIGFAMGCFMIAGSGVSDNQIFVFNDIEVIGNIWDNEDLLNDN